MSRGGTGIGVIIVAVSEVGAVVEQQAESAFTKLVAIPLKIVAAKLIDHDHDHQLGMAVIS